MLDVSCTKPRTRGFSIIEMCVAIILLGIAFMLTLKGRALIDNMRALMAGYEAQMYQTKVELYISEFHYPPGDDPVAPNRYGRPESITIYLGTPVSLAGNFKLNGLLTDPLNATGEQYMAWRDLRYAHLISGDEKLSGESASPENPFGGVFGFDEGNLGQTGGSLCLTKVPGRAAELIDKRLDDGVVNTGKVVATSKFSLNEHNHFAAPDLEPYDYAKTYIVCMPMLP
jgi:prepilin-type N-terminal cleavage/methylation domain-containing protein